METRLGLLPDDGPTRYQLIKLLLLYKKQDEAREHYRTLQQTSPKLAARLEKHF